MVAYMSPLCQAGYSLTRSRISAYTDLNNIGAPIVYTTTYNKPKYEENFLKVFYFKIQKCAFVGAPNFVYNFFKKF